MSAIKEGKTSRSKDIFIVHGIDIEPMKELKAMLIEFSFNPIVLHEQPTGSRTIVEKLGRRRMRILPFFPSIPGGHENRKGR
jgi:predicted nucleotide-binding protein